MADSYHTDVCGDISELADHVRQIGTMACNLFDNLDRESVKAESDYGQDVGDDVWDARCRRVASLMRIELESILETIDAARITTHRLDARPESKNPIPKNPCNEHPIAREGCPVCDQWRQRIREVIG